MALRTPAVPYAGVRPVVGVAVTLALHALVFVLASTHLGALKDGADPPRREQTITLCGRRFEHAEFWPVSKY